MWLDKTKNKVVFAVAVGVAVVVVTLLVLAIPKWGPLHTSEGGLLTVCWDEGGRARYVDDIEAESCEGAEELVWPASQIPIIVAPLSGERDELLHEDDRRSRVFDQAIRYFNDQVGFTLFRRFFEGGVQASAWVHFGQGIEARRGAETPPGFVTHYHDGERLSGEVYVRSDVESSDRLLFLVLLHEFGHLAGLAHDPDNLGSVMYPITRDDSMDDLMSLARITDHDRALLRRLYR